MSESISQVTARIREIQRLLGEPAATNRGFGDELQGSLRPVDDGGATTSHSTAGASAAALQPLIDEAAGRTGLSEELISAVVGAESGYQPDAVSPAGAVGLMQLMPSTARALGVSNPLDPRQNLLGGAEYLRRQLDRFGSLEQALAAYNAGPGAVERHGGIPPYPETQSYVRRVMETLRRWTHRRE